MVWFKNENDEGGAEGEAGLSEQEKLQRRIFISTFAMLSKMAGADGTVKKREVEAVDRFMKIVLKLDPERRQFAIKIFNKARNSPKTFKEFAEEYRTLLKDKPEMYEWMVDVLARISLADEVFSGAEAQLLQTACEVFGINQSRYAQLYAKEQDRQLAVEEDDTPYRVLNLTPQSTDAEIDKAYKELERQYDPQKIIASGLPEEFIELAEEKYAALRQAYAEIRRRRGR